MGLEAETETGVLGDSELQQQQRASFITNRRAGSSWNRGSSAWNRGGPRELPRVRRRGATDVNGSEEHEAAADSDAASGRGSKWDDGSQTQSLNTDEPRVELHIQKDEGVFKVNGSVETVVDPDTLYGIITNYDSNARVFRNVDRVEVEERGGEKIVTQFLHWSFLMWSGNYDIKMRMKDDPNNRTVSYELEQPGFLKIFNGSWKVEPLSSEGQPLASKLILNQKALPSFFPPGPLGTYASRIMSGQVRNLLVDLATEASEVKRNTGTSL